MSSMCFFMLVAGKTFELSPRLSVNTPFIAKNDIAMVHSRNPVFFIMLLNFHAVLSWSTDVVRRYSGMSRLHSPMNHICTLSTVSCERLITGSEWNTAYVQE